MAWSPRSCVEKRRKPYSGAQINSVDGPNGGYFKVNSPVLPLDGILPTDRNIAKRQFSPANFGGSADRPLPRIGRLLNVGEGIP